MKNKVTNRFLSKLILKLNLTKFEGNTENTRSSIDDRGSERVKHFKPSKQFSTLFRLHLNWVYDVITCLVRLTQMFATADHNIKMFSKIAPIL